MCGIIGYIGFQDPKNILLDGLKRLEYRGYDSAGIAVLEKGEMQVFRCEGRLEGLEKKLGGRRFEASVGIGHTRWATHGAPTELNAHPHRVGSITLVHNGIIENYLEHRDAIQKLGCKVTSDTDSEVVAHLFDLEIQKGKSLTEALTIVLPRLKGSYAFVILNDKEPDVMVGVRNGAPLLVGLGTGENFVASDVQAILHRTNRIVYLRDGHAAICNREKVTIRTEAGKDVPYDVKTINWSPDQMEKLGYRHYMLKEIHEQPRAITNTIEGNIDHDHGIIALKDLAPARDMLKNIKRITIVACGTARHAGLIGKYYLERYAQLPVDVDFGSEFRYRDPILEPNTLVLLISQSGETADTLAALREAKSREIPTLTVCNVRESSLARDSDVVLYTNAGPEIGVASTKAFTTQLVVLYMLSIELGYMHGKLPEAEYRELTNDLIQLPFLVDKALQLEKEVERIAIEHQTKNFFFYMGRGTNYPIALEGALKLKEISYLHAEGYPAGELKHGPIALVDRNAAMIVLAPKDRPGKQPTAKRWNELSETIYEKNMSNLQEVKSRGGQIFCVGTEGDSTFSREAKHNVAVPETSWGLNPILLSIPMQFFAYYMALERGTDVDKPRNLAKSVTVE